MGTEGHRRKSAEAQRRPGVQLCSRELSTPVQKPEEAVVVRTGRVPRLFLNTPLVSMQTCTGLRVLSQRKSLSQYLVKLLLLLILLPFTSL